MYILDKHWVVGVTGALSAAQKKRTSIVHRWFDDMSAFTGGAVALLLVSFLFLLAVVQSPTMLPWTGTAVGDVRSGGINYYSFQGQEYTLTLVPGERWSSTVYLDPQDPSHAMFAHPAGRWIEGATVVGPFAGAFLLLAFGFARRSKRRRNRLKGPGSKLSFGKGLDDGTVGQLPGPAAPGRRSRLTNGQ